MYKVYKIKENKKKTKRKQKRKQNKKKNKRWLKPFFIFHGD